MTTLTRDEARRFTDRIARDPAWFCEHVLGCTPYDKQIEMIEAVRDNHQVSVVGANGVGKDWMVGRIVAWWQSAHYPAKTIITGPSARQVADIVWREVRMAYHSAKAPLGGRMLPVEALWETSDDHFALGFSTDRPFKITGFHSPNLLVVVTEAHGFADAHMTMVKRLLPNRLILTGNAFADSGEFFASHHDKRNLYRAIRITAYDSPNVKAGEELVPGVVNAEDIEKMRADWGEDSPLFKATVDAEFAASIDGLIPLALLMAARNRDPVETDAQVAAGLDVAGPGKDETALTIRRGPNILEQKAWSKPDPRGEVVAALRPWLPKGLKVLNVDAIGIGWGMYLHLKDELKGITVNPVNVGEAANDTERFANLKAEIYWGMRLRCQAGDITGLKDETAIAQLAGIRYQHNARGQVIIESKKEAKSTGGSGGKSPDRGESVILAFYEPKRSGVRVTML